MNKYEVELTIKYDFTSEDDLDGPVMATAIKEFVNRQLIGEVKKFGKPGKLFDVVVKVEGSEEEDSAADQMFKTAMADYIDRIGSGSAACDCPTCTKVKGLMDMIGPMGTVQFASWLRTGSPSVIAEKYSAKRLLAVLTAIGVTAAMSKSTLDALFGSRLN